MFSMFKRSAAAAVLEETPLVVPTRVTVQPTMDDEARAEYVEKAKALGVVNAALKQEMLLALLRENGISIYPYEKVKAYLDKMFGLCQRRHDFGSHYPSCDTWGWHPLRAEDNGKLSSGHNDVNGRIQSGIYQ